MTKKDLEKITEVKFERGIINVVRELRSQIQNAVNMINDINYYKSKGYKPIYYFNSKEKTYSYFAAKREVGFQPKYDSKRKNKRGFG